MKRWPQINIVSALSVILPKALNLDSDRLTLQAIDTSDAQFHTDIYSDVKLMYYINDQIDLAKILDNFKILIDEINQLNPRYISYVIKHKSDKLGVFGIKLLGSDELEIGMIIKNEFQLQGWSKMIKQAFIRYAFEVLKIKHIIAYCKHDNGAANHVNKTLGFKLEEQFIHKSKNHLMNKWVLTYIATNFLLGTLI
ncbi:hypothetical protein MNBD_GAMMA02-205 [hydrothermal vent metagenome]|uniref:N-acetyltransferase domain-containing protein n=1 Tax=hydrothermal vent metagenome TaxID=652676 RepID=A0A3B0VQ16_9ZZZZ